MTNGRVEVVASVGRRRWSAAEKRRLVAATLAPDASVSAIAREAGIHPSQLSGWRRRFGAATPTGFAPVRIAGGPGPEGPAVGGIEVEFAGARLRIAGAADPGTVSAVIAALAREAGR